MNFDPTTTPTDHEPPPELARAVVEIEQHVGVDGWDQNPRLYALAPTGELVEHAPQLVKQLGLKHEVIPDDALTPIEQDVSTQTLDDLLPSITWPDSVRGCAIAIERIVLPPGAEDHVPNDDDAAMRWAQTHPQRTDVRVVVAVLRDGSRTSVMRVRGHEADEDLIRNAELSPEIGDALADTLT
ncbi:PPA1309 family protein [Phytoactinopolyspora limicola]|uniref:PPA1309 family protein n=1 Tax=Phytoactinopolyspora limicola TaxID=2715536 RepID=UPI00140E0192|nr:PPA1309 family protein [Phytoactinopolyspora limicola]